MMYGVIDMIFSPVYTVIPEELWKMLLNAVVENFYSRANNKMNILAFRDTEDVGALGVNKHIVGGTKSNFQRLKYFNNKVS